VRRIAPSLSIACALLACAGTAHAQRSVTGQGVAKLGASAAELLCGSKPRGMVSAIVAIPPETTDLELQLLGLRALTPGHAAFFGESSTLAGFVGAHLDWPIEIAPPLRKKLDLAAPFVSVSSTAPPLGLDGKGVYVGIVDTGLDILHDDFLTSDGKTRVAWLLDFSQTPREGNALDQKYGGRVFDRAAIDAMVKTTSRSSSTPTDIDGHGTHVAGIATANGGSSKRYVGIAPGADIVIVRATRDGGGGIFEADAVMGAKFVFDMATDDARPAVVNLSLGSQFGPHDGTSDFEQSLSALARGPGRAVVVAASNEGALPIHTALRVTRGATFEVGLDLPGKNGKSPYGSAGVYVWLNFRDGGDIHVGLEGPTGKWITPIERGLAAGCGASPMCKDAPEVQAQIVNDIQNPKLIPRNTHGAYLVLNGALPIGTYKIVLEGDGAIEAWVEGTDDAQDGPSSPTFAGAHLIEGSIGVPASAAGLISVGCVNLRQTFSTLKAEFQVKDQPPGERCYYSSAGPSANGALRPDFLAPGNFVISSLSRSAYEIIPNGSFTQQEVVDAQHAVLQGTSMSTPFGTGAVALLFQHDPTLTQEGARLALMAGARPVADDGAAPKALRDYAKGAGILDVAGALASLDSKTKGTAVSLQLRLGGSYLASDGKLPLWVLGIARDASGRPADLDGAVHVELEHALVSAPMEHPTKGLYRFSVRAEPEAQIGTATIRLVGNGLRAEREVTVAPDPWDARSAPKLGGGCTHGRSSETSAHGGWFFGIAIVTAFLRRSRSRSRVAGLADRPRATA